MASTIHELKAQAAELGLSPDDVRQYGNLTLKTTWQHAIAHKKIEIVSQQNSTAVNDSVQNEPNEPEITVTVKTWDSERKLLKTFTDIDGELKEQIPFETEIDLPQEEFLKEEFTEDSPAVKTTCPICNGTGYLKSEDHSHYSIVEIDPYNNQCPACDGKGFIDADEPKLSQNAETVNQPTLYECPHCSGDGKFMDDDNESGWKECGFCDGKKFVTEQACEEYQRWEKEGGSVEMNHSSPILPFIPMEDWHHWDEKLQQWVKENPEVFEGCESTYRETLLKRLERYLNNGLLPEDFEHIKSEPLDEPTAAVYLGLLEESERMVQEAVAV